jgi:Domain of unknown function (DUF4333)
MRRLSAIILSAIFAAALAGCGTVVLDSGKIANTMRSVLVTQVMLSVQSVECPKSIKVGKGIVTYCTATLTNGHTVRMSATQTDSNGHVHVGLAEMVADEMQNFIVRALAVRGLTATATCPQHRPIVVGSKFNCTATDRQGRSAHVQITVTSPSAAFSTRIVS